MTDNQDLCDRCANHKAHFSIALAQSLQPGDRIEIDDRPFPHAGFICRSCAEQLKANHPGFYTLTEMNEL